MYTDSRDHGRPKSAVSGRVAGEPPAQGGHEDGDSDEEQEDDEDDSADDDDDGEEDDADDDELVAGTGAREISRPARAVGVWLILPFLTFA